MSLCHGNKRFQLDANHKASVVDVGSSWVTDLKKLLKVFLNQNYSANLVHLPVSVQFFTVVSYIQFIDVADRNG